MTANFDAAPILAYLSLSSDYTPSPSALPIEFLAIHLRQLPPDLLRLFSLLLTPSQRTVLPIIRNRRMKYSSTVPREFTWPEARKQWPSLLQNHHRPGSEQAQDEREWADRGLEFLGGKKGEVGKLGQLLGEYEQEREAERLRQARRERKNAVDIPEEEEERGDEVPPVEEQENQEQQKVAFERLIRERFIYGGLDSTDYDLVDWDDKWDEIDERDSEERWFDEEEEADAPIDEDHLQEGIYDNM